VEKPKVYDVEELAPNRRTSPFQLIMDSLDGEFYSMRQAARMTGVHIETLRRLCHTDRVKAPSKATKQGGLFVYLFTPEDIEEVREYFAAQNEMVAKNKHAVHANRKGDKIE